MLIDRRVRRGDLHPALLRNEVLRMDLACAGFLCCGAILGGAFALNWLPTDTWIYRGLEAVFRLPLLSLFFIGGLQGVSFTLTLWRERPLLLLLLATLTLATPAVPWAVYRWPTVWSVAAPIYLAAYTLLALALPLRWFFVDRGRLLERYAPKERSTWL